jgi:membrane peptidoglycan carboxypeptidase
VLRRWLLLVPGLGLLALLLVGGVAYALTDVPTPEEVALPQTTVITYADGVTEVGRVSEENRTDVGLEAVPVPVQQAVLAAENRQYYTEPGISPRGITRALLTNVRGGGEIQQGGSTITQQYAKQAILKDPERTYTRKVREIFLALKLDQTYSKDQVLEWYLNTVYFGRGAYGIQAAAETYFGKDASELAVAEGAVLASSVRSPAAYDPERHPQDARARFDYVLNGMVEQQWLAPAERSAVEYPTVLPAARPDRLAGQAGYLVRLAEEELTRRGFTEEQVQQGGLRVVLTVDQRAQDAAVEAIDEVLPERDDDVQPSLAAVEPGTGAIRALYGGPDYVTRPFNTATRGTAPAGSAFKPIVLATALEQGYSLRSRYDGNSPARFDGYTPSNAGGADYGQVDLVTATQESVNTAYVALADDLDLDDVAATARAVGIDSDVPADEGLSVALGGPVFVTPLEMAEAYATFAARGTHAEPYLVQTVTSPDGDVLFEARPRTEQALSRDTADDVTHALEQVVRNGTGTRARLSGGREAAGKTGTAATEEGDTLAVWFAGYTPQLAVAISVNRDRNAPIDDIARSVSGGRIPAVMFSEFLDEVLADAEEVDFPPPAFAGESRGQRARSRESSASSPTGSRGGASGRPSATPSASPSPDEESQESGGTVDLEASPPPAQRSGGGSSVSSGSGSSGSREQVDAGESAGSDASDDEDGESSGDA